MIKKYKAVCILMFIVSFFLISNNPLSAEVIQQNTPPNFSIEIFDFVLIGSIQNGNILTKTYQIKAQNIGIENISNVSLALIHSTGDVTINDKDVLLGEMGVTEVIISSDTFSYSVDTSQQASNIEMTWEVGYTVNGEQVVDEVLVKETTL